MPITPLPQFERDLAEYLAEKEDRAAYERLRAPKTIVVRFGAMKMVGEFPYKGDAKPGCGSKLVVRTHRGTEVGEMLTSTCPNAGCSKSVTRKEMLSYIENSGGKQYPFHAGGRVLRIATKADLDAQARIEQSRHALKLDARRVAAQVGLDVKIVDVEPILGGERITVYFGSEDRVDFRELVQRLQTRFGVRVDMRQIGARDEARVTADYERCGQYCCCKNFLKVLKPVSMKSAKVQKATLDPLKISGRCGRLMCCLRYEDETYDELRKRLPHRKSRVITPEGEGTVIDAQILTQLVLVRLDATNQDVAVPVEDIGKEPRAGAPGARQEPVREQPRPGDQDGAGTKKKRKRRRRRRKDDDDATTETGASPASPDAREQAPGGPRPDGTKKKKRRRRRRRRSPGDGPGGPAGPPGPDG